MKKTVVASSIVFALSFSTYLSAEELSQAKQEKTAKLVEALDRLQTEYSTAELLNALDAAPKHEKSKFHGSLGANIEIERLNRGDGITEGKVKYTLAQGNFRHDDLPGWDFGFYSAREELFNGNLKHARYNRGVNSIQEIYANRNYGFEKGNVGWGVKLAGESIDQRTTPEAKVFGSYRITDDLEIHGYALYHVEYKRGTGEFPYWEIEPGFGYKIADNSGAWLNFRLQEGQWKAKNGYSETEMEWIIKPGIWYSWGKLSASLWGEFGLFEKERDSDGAHLWTEDYSKVGISANYPVLKNWRVFSEVSYKKIDFESGSDKTEFDGNIPLFIVGANYSF